MAIDGSEREDFREICRSQGYADDHFALIVEETSKPGPDIHPTTETVAVRRKTTGTERSYPCGHSMAWVVAFETDLKLRVFD